MAPQLKPTKLSALDRRLAGFSRARILALASVGLALVGLIDYFTGYEIAFSFFYLGPIAIAAWYAGGRAGVWISVASCISWLVADIGVGHPYSHPAIPFWNALVRLGFFLVTTLLLDALHARLSTAQWLATNDALTGVLNPRGFAERLDYNLALARRSATALTIAYVDLDDFKRINDRYGHSEGDRLLRTVAAALRAGTRHTDAVARVGGDEFALLLPDTDHSGAEQVISKLKQGLLAVMGPGGSAATCSIGVVTFLHAPGSPEQALKAADGLMYEVKRQGKNAVAYRTLDTASGEALRTAAVEDTL